MSNSNVPEGILCTKSHEYVLTEGNSAKAGITYYAVEQLGDVVFIELPEIGSSYSKGEVFGTIESVKAASELYMPVSGKISDVNDKLITNPELINEDPYGQGWIIKISEFNSEELQGLMIHKEYCSHIEE